MPKLNIGMVGYGFMRRAHSNAWRQVRSFFDVPYEPVLKVICGRNESELKKVAHHFGWEEYTTRWEDLITPKDIDVIEVFFKQLIERIRIWGAGGRLATLWAMNTLLHIQFSSC